MTLIPYAGNATQGPKGRLAEAAAVSLRSQNRLLRMKLDTAESAVSLISLQLKRANARTAELERILAAIRNAIPQFAEPKHHRIPISQIVAACARHFGVSIGGVMGQSRGRTLINPRHAAAYLAHELSGESSVVVGRYLGDRDHTTILHAIARVKKLLVVGGPFAESVSAIRANLEKHGALTNPPGAPPGAAAVTRPPEPAAAPFLLPKDEIAGA